MNIVVGVVILEVVVIVGLEVVVVQVDLFEILTSSFLLHLSVIYSKSTTLTMVRPP